MTVFKGICTALITPFDDEGNVDYEAFERIIEFQISGGVDALLVCGTTGEAAVLREKEKLEIIRFAKEKINGRVKLLVGAGSNDTGATIAFARQAEELSPDALLMVTPYYNKTSQAGLFEHYSAVCGKIALPVIVYNVPSRTGVNIMPDTMKKLSDIPNVVGIKEASGNMAQAVEMAVLCKGKTDIYSGNDDISVPMYSIGAKGTISVISNIFPTETAQMAHDWFEGNTFSAAKLQKRLYPVIKMLFADVNPIPVKAAAAYLGLCGENLRLPLVKLDKNKRRLLYDEIDEFIED